MSPPHGDLVLSGVSIRAGPNLIILGVKFDSKLIFEDHVHCIVSRVSQRIGILKLVKRIFVDTSVLLCCYFAFVLPILEYCSPVWGSVAECHLVLLERKALSRSEFLVAVSSTSCDGLVCCTRLIQTLITVRSVSFHLLLLEFDIPELQLLLIHPFEFEVLRCRMSQFARSFLLAQVQIWNVLPYTMFDI